MRGIPKYALAAFAVLVLLFAARAYAAVPAEDPTVTAG